MVTIIDIIIVEIKLSTKKSLFVDVLNPYSASITNVEKNDNGIIDICIISKLNKITDKLWK